MNISQFLGVGQEFSPPIELETGSAVLDRLLKNSAACSGKVLNLHGRRRPVQLAVLLGLCKAAIERGASIERGAVGVFLDPGATLTPDHIRCAGLSPYFNTQLPDDPGSRFRVFRPQTPMQVVGVVQTLSQDLGAPSVAVIHGLPELWERWYLGENPQAASGQILAQQSKKAGKFLYHLLLHARDLCGESGLTLWITHSHWPDVQGVQSSDHGTGDNPGEGQSHRADPTSPTMPPLLDAVLRNTLINHANYSVKLGRGPRQNPTDKHFQMEVQIRHLGSVMVGEKPIEMWRDGQFKNP